MRDLQVGCTLEFDVARPAEIVLQLAVARRPGVTVDDRLDAWLDDRPVPVVALDTPDGGRVHLFTAAPGRLRIAYDARAAVEASPAAVTPLERIAALQPSRYCPSDRLLGFAERQFGQIDDPAAVAAFVHDRTRYVAGASTVTTDATDTLLSGEGVCRDYAHLVCALCRALGIPARLAAVYAPGLSPMDFHAVAEVAVGGVWQIVDATRLAPRTSLIRIATGPDAAATAFATVQSGAADLVALNVRAIVDGDLPADDHTGPATLA
ncbi:transglutaminase family protein [Actinoplanes sp. NPDC051513]|uniref:transglutaminase family protein n=1 Tax=Actinoplanes sp. NPDC051513 TaxID=3363908 RepID=UPI00378DA3E4